MLRSTAPVAGVSAEPPIAPLAPSSAAHPSPERRPEGSGAFRDYLAQLAGTVAEGESLVGGVLRGEYRADSVSHVELIALQAGVYRYTQELELASRLVDRATGAVKQTLQSQT